MLILRRLLLIEELAKQCAIANNGGDWKTHYTDEQKQFWRNFAQKLVNYVKENLIED